MANPAGRTTILFQGNSASAGDVSLVNTGHNQRGLVQLDFADYGTAGDGFKLEIQGRVRPDMNWAVLATLDQTDLDTNGSAVISTPLVAEMRAELTSVSGTLSANAVLAVLQQ